MLTFLQSSSIDVDAFIRANDFKMHHVTLFFSNGEKEKTFPIFTKIKVFKKFEKYFRK